MNRCGLFRKTLRDVRTSTIAVAITNFAMAFVLILLYPEYRDSLADFDASGMYEGFLGEAGSITSPEGFLSAEFFSWIPLLLITVAIIGGTGAFAGEEGAGTLDFLLAQPISRRRLVVEKAAALSLAVAIAALASFPGFLLGRVFVEFDLGLLRVFEAVVNMLPVTLLFLALALWGSAAFPGRGAAAMLSIGVVVVMYFLNTIGAAVDLLDTPRKITPFYWSDGSHVLIHGFDPLRAGGLLAVAAIFFVLAVASFERRDVSTGSREWSLRGLLHRGPAATPPPGEH